MSVASPFRPTAADPVRRIRKFNLGDGLILTAATALSSSACAGWDGSRDSPPMSPGAGKGCHEWDSGPPGTSYLTTVFRGREVRSPSALPTMCSFSCLSSLSVGFMVAQPLLRLLHPRPEPRRLMRQSGFVACMVSMAAALLAFAIMGSDWFSELALSLVPIRVVGRMLFWIVLGLPPWRAEPSWIDRLGRAVGWGWIIAIVAQAVFNPRRLM